MGPVGTICDKLNWQYGSFSNRRFRPEADGRKSRTGSGVMKIIVVLSFALSTHAVAQESPLPEVEHSKIGYNSPAEALAALQSKPNVEFSVQGGWTIAYESASHVIWSFAPKSHASYPSVVKRAVVEKNGAVFLSMDVKCQASKEACDELVREFTHLNEAMRSSMQTNPARTN
jgi:hypothetical protein